ncbi:hypothetical protein PN36_11635 [Candidatus Thiomargarita nelsonii]|uniref:HTH merR-type domain-containing protein n=1 Tax=Candidatus Thiomargarita nelsonii TaxID=1003181 RepID=A0A0A6PE81_9GAMM|nr:hypothetical protein PN36_11635 [Candidatus Thiomargarita nelsonii]
MNSTYKFNNEFAKLINRSVKTLQKWERPTNRRYYTHDQYLSHKGIAQKDALQIKIIANYSGTKKNYNPLKTDNYIKYKYIHQYKLFYIIY